MKKYNFIEDIIVSHDQLVAMSYRVGSEIEQFYWELYPNSSELVVITIMNGGLNFSRSLFSSGNAILTFNMSHYALDKIDISNIQSNSIHETKRLFMMLEYIKDKPVLIIDDIYDTGKTLNNVVSLLKIYSPSSIECCVMIERKCEHISNLDVRFVGIKVDTQKFLVGSGLDYKGKFRDIPYIGTLKSDFNEEPVEECICNKCGQPCTSIEAIEAGESKECYYGFINAIARGYYFSPVLHDCVSYKFDLCEKCLKFLFNSFIVPVEEHSYDPWTGNAHE